MTSNRRPPGEPLTPSLDRKAYLKKIREDLLVRLGLPPRVRPERVLTLLTIKNQLHQIAAREDPENNGG